ncbi:MGDG synthase family glycosyltransferase [Peptostreptococcus sp. D1]|uniref:MGDG synthase family glycosyltransferase n=1 Tax=Peptostreptococcus sp. D1 TaxID=72304 RepID=UPI0008F1207A|nr:glycosyltransferase [Peptostreptococcus sp. D1]SFE66179.1 processive 1,2-diacylglycerol beta-glucosyltransferase [Peptostreptococcus sp. D1]
MKKVFIMTASTGGGHNRAAKAIAEELEKRTFNGENIKCYIKDSFKLVNQAMDKVISEGYEMSAKYTPKAYGTAYSLSDKKFFSFNEYKNNPISLLMARKFKKLIKEEQPDLIIGTHAFPLIALSRLKKSARGENLELEFEEFIEENGDIKYEFPPLISVLTDYTAHSTYLQEEIDYYICGDEYVKELLIEDGISPNRVKPFGIPVEKSFLESRPRDIVLEELGLDPRKRTVLLMGGSFGAGNIKGTLDDIATIDRDFQVLVITGRNKSLQKTLESRISEYDTDTNIKIIGFTNIMNDILPAIDLLVTKPGGLTTTEALLKEVPMIIPYFIPGQEEENLDFLTNCGVAIRTTNKFSIKSVIKVLIDNPERIERMKGNIKLIKKLNSAENIAKLSMEIFENCEVDYSNTFSRRSVLDIIEDVPLLTK